MPGARRQNSRANSITEQSITHWVGQAATGSGRPLSRNEGLSTAGYGEVYLHFCNLFMRSSRDALRSLRSQCEAAVRNLWMITSTE